LLEAFWLDVTTSRDECTWTRLNRKTAIYGRRFFSFFSACLS